MSVNTYPATAALSESMWVLEVYGLPEGVRSVTRGRTVLEARAVARVDVARLLEVTADAIDISIWCDSCLLEHAAAAVEAYSDPEGIFCSSCSGGPRCVCSFCEG
ncbi:hypothetical protein [Nocardia jejuensis]|uniref:hypothetical protein n=1 Tax=Nocardia jejuensis TaxID=328049 RepID=UPI0012F7F1F9|nr:hypothetical protein [Nocardia jejuensis]